MTDRVADSALRLLAPRARVLGTGDGDSLQNINTTELPNGCLCWVNQNGTLYRFDKRSTAASAPDAVIVPGSGPGRWVALSGNALLSNARMSMFRPDDATVVVGTGNTNKWMALPVEGGGDYFPQVAGAAFWSVAGTTGIATYSGPNMIYHFTVSMALALDGEATVQAQLALTVNGEDIGTTNTRDLATRTTVVDSDHFQGVSLANEVALATGDTVQLILRDQTGEDDLIASGIQMIGIPVGVVTFGP